MKIADFQVVTVGTPPPHLGGRYWMFVVLATDDGISGVGEAYGIPFHPRAAEAMLADVCERVFVGTDPFRVEQSWRRAFGRNYSLRPDPSLMACVSAAETACWDIAGKALGRPVCDLLGGRVRERLRTYTYLYPEADDPGGDGGTAVYEDADLAATRAAEYAKRGFTGVKFDPVGPYTSLDPRQLDLASLSRAERFAERIRSAVGDSCDLLIGTHGQMTASGALRLARRLERFDPLWLEEPTPPDNPGAMATVARGTTIPIAAGERLTTKWEFARLLEAGAASVLQPALGRAGGVLETKKIAALGEASGASFAPHLYCGPVAAAANIHAALTCPNFLILEAVKDFGGFHSEALRRPLLWEDGFALPPEGAGLGVELDLEFCARHPYKGEGLHLQTREEPLDF